MKRSALGYNFYVNPFSSHAADVFHHFAYIISATMLLYTNLNTLHVERYCWYAWQQSTIVCAGKLYQYTQEYIYPDEDSCGMVDPRNVIIVAVIL